MDFVVERQYAADEQYSTQLWNTEMYLIHACQLFDVETVRRCKYGT